MSTSRLLRWTGLAAIAGGLLYVVSGVAVIALGLGAANLPDVAGTGGWVFWRTVYLAGYVLILLGLVGLYVRQSEAAGTLGLIGFLLAFIGQALVIPDAWISAFLAPELAKQAPALLEAMLRFETLTPLTVGLGVSWGIQNLGWILFGIATMRARVLPRWGALLLIVGILIGLLGTVAPVVWSITAVVFGLGFFWLGYALWSGTRSTGN